MIIICIYFVVATIRYLKFKHIISSLTEFEMQDLKHELGCDSIIFEIFSINALAFLCSTLWGPVLIIELWDKVTK